MSTRIIMATAQCANSINCTLNILLIITHVVHSHRESAHSLSVVPDPGETGQSGFRVQFNLIDTDIVLISHTLQSDDPATVSSSGRIRRALTELDERSILSRLNDFRRSVKAANMQYVVGNEMIYVMNLTIWNAISSVGCMVISRNLKLGGNKQMFWGEWNDAQKANLH